MLEKLFKKSEVWFAVIFISAYVIGNSAFLELSDKAGLEMLFTIPYNLLLLGILFVFIKKNDLSAYYGFCKVTCKAADVLYFIPLIVIATVNIWMGIAFKMNLLRSLIYFAAMVITGVAEELLFRGLLFRGMAKSNIRSAIIVTSILFGAGHIVNLVNGNSSDYVATICQLFYAVAIGFLLVAVLYAGKSIIPCIITHSMLNALSTFSNEAALDKIQIPVSVVLCLVSGISAFVIFKKAKAESSEED